MVSIAMYVCVSLRVDKKPLWAYGWLGAGAACANVKSHCKTAFMRLSKCFASVGGISLFCLLCCSLYNLAILEGDLFICDPFSRVLLLFPKGVLNFSLPGWRFRSEDVSHLCQLWGFEPLWDSFVIKGYSNKLDLTRVWQEEGRPFIGCMCTS